MHGGGRHSILSFPLLFSSFPLLLLPFLFLNRPSTIDFSLNRLLTVNFRRYCPVVGGHVRRRLVLLRRTGTRRRLISHCLVPRGETSRLVPARGRRRRLVPHHLVPRGEGGIASLLRGEGGIASPRAGRRGVASFLREETLDSTVLPGRGRSVYRYPIGPVHTARTRRYSSKRKTLGRHFFPHEEKKRLLPKKPVRGEETSSRSLNEKPVRLAKPMRGLRFFSSRSLDDVAEASRPHFFSPRSPKHIPTLPRLLLPAGNRLGSSRESDAGSPGSPFSSPSSSFSLG
ncbi:hypothetical protein GW17_00038978 [Ensete ventricosum]|nr:hypothetical protein GW17_00038978 [Ensete ventricosum]RZS18444.1 hypothetical protein BHM03_00050707 [Ensete ventricosum]